MDKNVQEALNSALATRRWMVAAWFVDDDNKIQLRRVTCDGFPRGDYLLAVSLLTRNIEEEVARVQQPAEPLPEAKLPPPPLRVASLPAAGQLGGSEPGPVIDTAGEDIMREARKVAAMTAEQFEQYRKAEEVEQYRKWQESRGTTQQPQAEVSP